MKTAVVFLNISWVSQTSLFPGDLIPELSDNLRNEFIKLNREIAHYKILAVSGANWAKASIFDISEQLTFDKRAQEKSSSWDIILNIRADMDDQILFDIVKRVLQQSVKQKGGTLSVSNVQCFKPKKPNPTYRIK